LLEKSKTVSFLVAAAEPRPLDGRAGVRTFRYMLWKSSEMVGCFVDTVVGHRDHAEVVKQTG